MSVPGTASTLMPMAIWTSTRAAMAQVKVGHGHLGRGQEQDGQHQHRRQPTVTTRQCGQPQQQLLFTSAAMPRLNLGTGNVTISGNTLTLDGVVSGAFGLDLGGGGNLVLGSNNAYSHRTLGQRRHLGAFRQQSAWRQRPGHDGSRGETGQRLPSPARGTAAAPARWAMHQRERQRQRGTVTAAALGCRDREHHQLLGGSSVSIEWQRDHQFGRGHQRLPHPRQRHRPDQAYPASAYYTGTYSASASATTR